MSSEEEASSEVEAAAPVIVEEKSKKSSKSKKKEPEPEPKKKVESDDDDNDNDDDDDDDEDEASSEPEPAKKPEPAKPEPAKTEPKKKKVESVAAASTPAAAAAAAADAGFKRRTGRFSEIVRKSAATSTASFSSNRLTRRTVRQKKGLTELIVPSRSKVKGAPLNDSELQLNVVENFCTYLERYALGIDGIFSQSVPEAVARNVAQMLNQDSKTIDFQSIVEPPEIVAAALLQYLQSHKKTMVPSKNYDQFVAANGELKHEARVAALRGAVVALPAANRAICGRLIRLLYAIAENKEFTGQDHAALGALFGDTLLHNKASGGGEAASGADLIAFMVEQYYPVVFQAEFEAEQKDKKEYEFDVALTESDWKLLLTNAKLYKYKRDQTVLQEGEPNTLLYRVRKGEFKVVKKGKHIATLEPLAMFGEISFLGSYIAEATVSAVDEDAELWILDLKFVQQMFAMEPELAMKFYHFIGSYLAKRLLHVAGGARDPFVAKTDSFVRAAPAAAPRPAGELAPISEELVIKDYPCKLDKDGTLYIMQHYLSHFAPLFGRERKKIVPYDYVTSLTMADNLKELLIVRKQKNKVLRFEFQNTQDCDEAFALIETMLLNRRRDAPFPSAAQHSRAVALYDFAGEHEHDLAFKVKDVIIVHQKRPDGWWLGERRGKLGYFPATYVRDDEGLPTLHDWEIVWLGGVTSDAKKGDTIVAQNARPAGLYQILHGQCDVVHDGKPLATLNKDETFGEISYLGRTDSPDAIVASGAGKTSLRLIPSAWLDKLFKNSPALASRVFKYLAVVLEMKLRSLMDPPSAADSKKKSSSSSKQSSAKEESGAVTARDNSDDDADADADKHHHHHHHHGEHHGEHHHDDAAGADSKKKEKKNKRRSGEHGHKRRSGEHKPASQK